MKNKNKRVDPPNQQWFRIYYLQIGPQQTASEGRIPCAHIGLGDEADAAHDAAGKMAAVVLDAGWDGAWFRRAYDAGGEPVGSCQNEEGQIYIEPQGFCVMAGIGVQGGQAEQALKSVEERLDTQYGIVLLQPAYTRYHLELGEITSYPPGYKENAGIFCHNNPWVSCAETVLGMGTAPLRSIKRPARPIWNPSARCTAPSRMFTARWWPAATPPPLARPRTAG